MTNSARFLLQYVCEGDILKAQKQAEILLSANTTKKDEYFKTSMLELLKKKSQKFVELPPNLKSLVVAENISDFPNERFLLRDSEREIADKLLMLYSAAEKLSELDISYYPALLLHGPSGTGKTMLARYIAHKANLPFIYVRFSSLVDSLLGKTQQNISTIFEYVRRMPCVLCFDEIDAIGMARGHNDVNEMNRVVIAMMQEMDMLPNNVIVIGTTNRYDFLDKALVRRFPLQHRVDFLTCEDAKTLALKFFSFAKTDASVWFDSWFGTHFDTSEISQIPASAVVKECTERVVELIVENT